MKKMFSDYKKIVFTLTALIAIVGYSFVVFAAAPNGGYNPGQILDPDCAPGDVDCVVKLQISGGGSPAGSDTQIQYNNAGAFGADSNFFRDLAANLTFIANTDGANYLGGLQNDNGTSGIFSVNTSNGTISNVLTDIGNQKIRIGTQVGTKINRLTLDGTANLQLEMSHTTQSAVTFTGSGLDGMNVAGSGYSGTTFPNTYTVQITQNNAQLWTIVNINPGVFTPGEILTGVTSGETATFIGYAGIYDDVIIVSSVSGTFSSSEDIIGSISSVTQQFNSTYSTNCDAFTLTTSTGSSLGCTNSGSYDFGMGLDGVYPQFTSFSGYTIGDSWTWTYSNVNQNVLDFSNNDYKFQSVLGTDTFGYQIGDNLLGYGLKGSVNTWSTTGGDIGVSGFTDLEDGFGHNTLFTYGDGTNNKISLLKNSVVLQLDNSSSQKGSLIFSNISFALTNNTSSGNRNGITFNESNSGLLQIGNLANGNNTKITIDDIAQTINFNNSYSFPFADGTAGQMLTTDGFGHLSWTTPNGGGGGGGTSPISVDASGTTLYSSGLSGTGQGDTYYGNNNFFGRNAGQNASNAYNSNFFGNSAGQDAPNADSSNFFGTYAGRNATTASNSNFFGGYTGWGATHASLSNFFGNSAGQNATNASASNFFGIRAGQNASNAYNSNFFGQYAGSGAASANNSNFIGTYAGNNASNGYASNFFGQNSGNFATNAFFSNFIGANAGQGATNAANSIFIGTDAGYSDSVNNTSGVNYSILIGNETSTGGFSNSIALGGYATNTASNQFMIGSTTRTIDTTVWKGAASTTCTLTTGTGMACSSDERLKTNITDLTTDTLERLLNLKTVKYNWLQNPTSATQIGFLAQDLEQYFPELVATDNEGMKSVYYAQMTPILVEAIREMNLKITTINDMATPNTWRDSLIAWFGNIENGIAKLFVKEIESEVIKTKDIQADKLCLEDICVTKDQLQQLLQQGQMSNNDNVPTVTVTTDPDLVTPDTSPVDPVNTDPVLGDTSNSTDQTTIADDVLTEQPSE